MQGALGYKRGESPNWADRVRIDKVPWSQENRLGLTILKSPMLVDISGEDELVRVQIGARHDIRSKVDVIEPFARVLLEGGSTAFYSLLLPVWELMYVEFFPDESSLKRDVGPRQVLLHGEDENQCKVERVAMSKLLRDLNLHRSLRQFEIGEDTQGLLYIAVGKPENSGE